jgi:hypothetical protein
MQEKNFGKDIDNLLASDPLMPGPSQGGKSAMDKLNLSPRMASKGKAPPTGTLKGDKDVEEGKKSRNSSGSAKPSDKAL